MQASERTEFTEIFTRLCNVFDKPVSPELADAYWKATEYMNARSFRIACERAIERDERMPRPSQLWKHHREAKSSHRALETLKSVEPTLDHHTTFRNRQWLRYAMRKGPFTPGQLDQMREAGTRIMESFKIIATEESVEAEEIRASLYRDFDRIFEVKP